MTTRDNLDATDARMLLELIDDPRATVLALAGKLAISRNTAQARLAKLERVGALQSYERSIDAAALGYPLSAFITVLVTQQLLPELSESLAAIPEVVEVIGLTGATDLLVRVVARDADDLYRIAGQILDTRGVERTTTALAMRQLVNYRLTPLINRVADRNDR